MEHMSPYLSSLNDEQLEAVCHTGSPLLILAGAGSGKTRVITTKIAWLIGEKHIEPESILAVTFTNKAAREMAERAQALDPRSSRSIIKTFHSFGAWLLRRYAEWAGLSPQFTIYDDEDSVSLLMKAVPQLNKNEAQGFMRKISRAKDHCYLPEDPLLASIDPDPEFAVIYRHYQDRLKETGNADFGDLILLPVQLLEQHPAAAASLHSRFKVILVDEYQDSNGAQFRFLKALTGPHTYVCVVGDDDQSIYRFRGAEIQNILTFEDRFAETTVIRLIRNYRSYAPILRVADSVVSHNTGRLGKTLLSARGESPHKPAVYYLPNQDAEAELCAQLIKTSVSKGGSYSDWAILYRTNAQSLTFETLFLHQKIPYQVIGTLKFYEREEIKDALALCALVANGRDELAFRRLINKPARGIGEVTQNKLIAYARDRLRASMQQDLVGAEPSDLVSIIQDELSHIKLSKKTAAAVEHFCSLVCELKQLLTGTPRNDTHEGTTDGSGRADSSSTAAEGLALFVQTAVETSGLRAYHESQDEIMGTQKTVNLQELANTASLYPCTMDGLVSFLEHIELDRTLAEQNGAADAVHLITMHNTKGLEFKHVIITGLENSIFPRNDESDEDMEEERRLMYVACTRAEDTLHITSCATRRMYGRLSFMQPSRFLSEIDPELVTVTGEYFSGAMPKPADSDAALWKCGQKIYHDDYGYGYVVESRRSGGELIITVQFETGMQKRFFPAYQKQELFRVDEW